MTAIDTIALIVLGVAALLAGSMFGRAFVRRWPARRAAPLVPRIRIEIQRGEAVFTRVFLDGVQMAATRVRFDTGERFDGLVQIHLDLVAHIELEGDAGLTISGVDPRAGATFEAVAPPVIRFTGRGAGQ